MLISFSKCLMKSTILVKGEAPFPFPASFLDFSLAGGNVDDDAVNFSFFPDW